MKIRRSPESIGPIDAERFDRLLGAMLGVPVSKTQTSDNQTSDAEHDEGCGDIQAPTDTSEDAS